METYTIDPHRISLDRFHKLTASKHLIPSRVALREMIDERFGILRDLEIENLGELLKILKSKQSLQSFASLSGIPIEYLVLLKREAGSYLARPFPLSDFPGMPHEYVEVLKSKGIRHTREFFELARTDEQQMDLSHQTGIPLARVKELFALSDLSRITGIGGVFARIVYEAGVKSVEQFALTSAAVQYQKYMAIINKYKYPAGHFCEEDIQYCIDYASVILEC
jgi:hypothetical protein